MRAGVKVSLVSGALVALIGGGGYGAYNLVHAVTSGTANENSAEAVAKRLDTPLTARDVRETGEKFLRAWGAGRVTAAAALTSQSAPAGVALQGVRDKAHVTKVALTPGTATDTGLPYRVKLTVRGKTLSYDTRLSVVRSETTGRPVVKWAPSLVHPKMRDGDLLVSGDADAPPVELTDRDGKVLDVAAYPSLGPILAQLRERYGEQAGGSGAVELMIRHPDDAPDTTLLTLEQGKPGRVPTTLSAGAQAAAEKAVARYSNASVVVERAGTGEVLAVANHRGDQFNAAFQGTVAPGSTMKMITASLLIDKGLTRADGPAPCPDTALSGGQTVHNLTGMKADPGATLTRAFAISCNTSFVSFAPRLGPGDLGAEASEKFGLGRDNWKTGIASADGTVPVAEGDDKGVSLIGQGKVQLNPLNLASVVATIRTGAFRQPVLVPASFDKRPLATAAGLSAGTAAQLRQMMNVTATSGTGAAAMSGLGPDIGAKTGSAEVDGQAQSNSWFAGYRGEVTAAAYAEQGGHGGDVAGPIVAAVLRAAG
ncbi:penicillin-binding transpeptidase domain-containing protein [Streptomyces sp. SPB074]|uniref:penicillin-binding transpeptidase domain-containing protein n=1 Tax=Streptomyces sp. (strain SPB074) TaxID=465543 RepID=UPI00017F1BAA|nr:penicillin-binding transpeptidase domain-containing protein [Streptomyces sp. SPB074]EDY46569.1 penicillin-binding protein [Streptomyces sp. SPB074]